MARTIRCPTKLLTLDGLVPGVTTDCVLASGRLFVCDAEHLWSVRLAGPDVEWMVTRPRPPPPSSSSPRRIHSRRSLLWEGHGAIVQLHDTDEGVALFAHAADGGRALWRRDLTAPPPLAWTEAAPAWDGAATEELSAFLVASETLAVALARGTRQTTRWPDHPAPPFRAQLDVTSVSVTDGRAVWEASYPEVRVPGLEEERFEGFHLSGQRLCTIDWATGAARHLGDLNGQPSWPRRLGDRLGVATCSRGQVTVELFDLPTGAPRLGGTWRRSGVKATRLFAVDGHLVAQLNDQFVSLLSEGLTPCWEARAVPYVYGVAAAEGGPILVATSGNGGGAYAFDRRTGQVVSETRIPGGAWGPTAVAGTSLVAFVCWGGVLAIADGRDGRVALVEAPGATRIAAAVDGHVVVLGGEPRPGIQLLDVRRVLG